MIFNVFHFAPSKPIINSLKVSKTLPDIPENDLEDIWKISWKIIYSDFLNCWVIDLNVSLSRVVCITRVCVVIQNIVFSVFMRGKIVPAISNGKVLRNHNSNHQCYRFFWRAYRRKLRMWVDYSSRHSCSTSHLLEAICDRWAAWPVLCILLKMDTILFIVI